MCLFCRYITFVISNKGGITMPSVGKIISDIISAGKDSNIKFKDLQRVLDVMGFRCRIKGDHFIYYKDGIDEIINIQPKGNKAKPYQVKQIRNLILKYQLEV